MAAKSKKEAALPESEVESKPETALAPLPPQETALAVYTKVGGLDPWLEKIKAEVQGRVPDLKTKKGRDEIASLAYKVRQAKTALDGLGKDLVDTLKEAPKKVDAERKRMREILDALATDVRKPLTDWEEAEEAKVKAISEKIEAIKFFGVGVTTSDEMKHQISLLENLIIDDEYGDFKEAALELKDDHLRKLRANFATMQKAEADAIELAKLRHEAAEREKKEHEQRIAEEAAKKARAAAAAEIVERDRLAAKAIADAEALAKATKEAAEKRELELQLRAAESERLRLEQKQQAEQAAQDALDKAERDKAKAIQDEKERVKQQAAKEAAEARQREENTAHRGKINRAALAAFVEQGIEAETAKLIIAMIAKKTIPAISITY